MPVRRVVTTAHCLIRDKGPHTPENYATPDFSCACLDFDDGVVARLTNSIVATHDHRFRIFCEDGMLEVDETWDFKAPVRSIPVPSTSRIPSAGEENLRLGRRSAGFPSPQAPDL